MAPRQLKEVVPGNLTTRPITQISLTLENPTTSSPWRVLAGAFAPDQNEPGKDRNQNQTVPTGGQHYLRSKQSAARGQF